MLHRWHQMTLVAQCSKHMAVLTLVVSMTDTVSNTLHVHCQLQMIDGTCVHTAHILLIWGLYILCNQHTTWALTLNISVGDVVAFLDTESDPVSAAFDFGFGDSSHFFAGAFCPP